MMSHKLTMDDILILDEFREKFDAGLEALEKAKQYKVGDYLILYVGPNADESEDKMKLQVNSYGAPIKYKVVHTTSYGIPFLKKVNKKGNPVGHLYSCIGHLDEDDYREPGQKFQFELDPDYADSILLQDQYDPAILHKTKHDIWKAVTEHNKASKIMTNTLTDVVNFFNVINIGDILWTSNVSHYLVQDKRTISRADIKLFDVGSGRIRGPYITILTIRDKNNQVSEVTAERFFRKALYTARPRTYKELKI